MFSLAVQHILVIFALIKELFETTANQGSPGNLSSNQVVTLFLFSILYLLIINELQRNLAFGLQKLRKRKVKAKRMQGKS